MKQKQGGCKCGEGYGKCGECIMNESEKKSCRIVKKPNKQGVCNCLDDDCAGFVYTAYEMRDGNIVDVKYRMCENTQLTLIDLNQVKPNKLDKLNIVEKTNVRNMAWVEWCTEQCATTSTVN